MREARWHSSPGFSFLDPKSPVLQSKVMTTSAIPARSFELAEAIEILRRTPRTLDDMLRGLSAPWLTQNEGGESWSPFDIMGHLVHGEHTDWVARARMILQEGESRTFDKFDRTAMFRESQGKTIDQLLDEFAALRRANLLTVEEWRLKRTDYTRTGTHPAFGRVTLAQLLSTWAVHDLSHVAQICRVMARQYREAVGPWVEYLPILTKQEPQ